MKVFATLLFFTAVFGYIHSSPLGDEEPDLAENIRLVINNILENIADPFGVKDINIKIPANGLINGEFDINEISISGLKKLSIDTLTFDQSTGRLDYTVNYEDILSVIDTRLTITGVTEFDHPLYISIDFKNLKTEGYAIIAEDRKSVEDFSVLITLGESEFDVEGLLNNDELSKKVKEYLTENVAKFIDNIAPILSPVASGVIKTIINIALKIKG